MSPRILSGSVAVSKTFQILYRKEDVDLDDVIAFKVYMIADVYKVRTFQYFFCMLSSFQLDCDAWSKTRGCVHSAVPGCDCCFIQLL